MARHRGASAVTVVTMAAVLTGCGPSDERIPVVDVREVVTGGTVSATMGGDHRPDLRDLDDLELVATPLVDHGSRAWDAMPSNEDAARPVAGTAAAHAYRVPEVDLAPGEYAVWFRWGPDLADHSDGYTLLTVTP